MKEGTIFAEANFQMWRDYDPKPEWLRSLWGARKLSHSAYGEYSRQLRVGYADRKRDLVELMADERQQALRNHVATALARLESSGVMLPMRTFPEVDSFVELFRSEALLRRPIFAIVGGTNLGKSILAANVLTGAVNQALPFGRSLLLYIKQHQFFLKFGGWHVYPPN